MKYLVVEDGDVYDDYGDAIVACIDDDWHWDDDDDFENWVNDCYGDIEICGTRYYAYDILDNMGEDDLHDLRRDYCRDQNERDEDDARYCLEDADIGYTYELHGRTIEVIADEEDDVKFINELEKATDFSAAFSYICKSFINNQEMKKSVFILMAAAAMLVSCKTKTVEEKMAEFNEWNQTFMDNYRTRLASFSDDEQEAAEAFADSAYNAFLDYNKAALKANLDNAVGVEALKQVYSDIEPAELAKYLDKLSAPLEGKDSAFVAYLKENVNASLATAEGQVFTDFTVEHVTGLDESGEPVYESKSLSDFVGKGKVFLVDFWSPWCPPCWW